ncbi:MAG: TonB-dependent siderophore receptor [Burkholderiaceae bacterium]|nr:TonB-dependent siderophore receptor [Burkholderiaceae bacterium]
MAKRSRRQPRSSARAALPRPSTYPALLPLGAMLLVGSMSAMAQTGDQDSRTLGTVLVKERAEEAEGKDAYRAAETGLGKGRQQLRDIPQSVTVVTEKLIDDRNLDTVKEALKNTAGISFLAAEGGEEDIRLRGFSLQGTGDVFVDGVRDPAFYDRDTFNLDRLEVLRGSASMLFGRGSTGGAVNQVSKTPRLIDEHQVDVTVGSYNYRRVVGDFNLKTDDSAALRLNVMHTQADNNGAGSSIDKQGIAGTYRWGIGERDEFSAGFYHLDNNNGMNYGMPWIRPSLSSPVSETTLLPIDPSSYYGMASDYNKGTASFATVSHLHRFDDGSALKTQVRKGSYSRDQRAGTVRFANAASQPGGVAVSLDTFGPNTVLTRGTQLKIQDMNNLHAQSDYSTRFEAFGLKHELQAGVDLALENRSVYAARSAAQGGVTLTKPNTTVGTPNDGASVDEGSRVLRKSNQYDAQGWGAYVQDLVQVAPAWKLLAGLRYDYLVGNYDAFSIPTAAPGPEAQTSYQMKVAGWSQRLGALFQPNALHSYHFSAGTSYNVSGEAYSLGAANADTPPEESYNVEIGARLDSADKRTTTRLAAFQTVKYRERNTDPLQPGVTVLSGRRHVAGLEIDVSGRLTPKWEVFGSYMWLPVAKIDVGGQGAEAAGSRPSLTPIYSGTLWSTYQITHPLRAGAGLNFRGEQTPNRNPGWKAPAYETLDLMLEYRFSERYSLKGNVINVTDKLYADQLYGSGTSGHYIPGSGRNVQVTFTAKL